MINFRSYILESETWMLLYVSARVFLKTVSIIFISVTESRLFSGNRVNAIIFFMFRKKGDKSLDECLFRATWKFRRLRQQPEVASGRRPNKCTEFYNMWPVFGYPSIRRHGHHDVFSLCSPWSLCLCISATNSRGACIYFVWSWSCWR